MGVVNCSMEVRPNPPPPLFFDSARTDARGSRNTGQQVYGNFPGDPMLEQHFDRCNPDSIPCTVKRVLSAAKEQGIDTNAAAVRMADEASLVAHPITGHR